MVQKQQKLVILCGAPGSGKTTVQDFLVQSGFTKVITHTTRKRRATEQDGHDYYFETATSFKSKHYLETVVYDGQAYGSSFEGLKKALLPTGKAVIVLDTQGVKAYLEKLPAELLTVIFLKVPSKKLQKERLIARGDNLASIKQRLASKEAKRDEKLSPELESVVHVLVNQELAKTLAQVKRIVTDTPG